MNHVAAQPGGESSENEDGDTPGRNSRSSKSQVLIVDDHSFNIFAMQAQIS